MNTNTGIFFDLYTVNTATREETMLLYALGEELLLKDKHCEDFTRIDADTIRIKIVGINDATRALAHVLNKLRLSKNYVAHTCGFTMI